MARACARPPASRARGQAVNKQTRRRAGLLPNTSPLAVSYDSHSINSTSPTISPPATRPAPACSRPAMPSLPPMNGPAPAGRARRSSRPTPFTASQAQQQQATFAPTAPTHSRGPSSSGNGYFFPGAGAGVGTGGGVSGGMFGGLAGEAAGSVLERSTRWQYETAIELHAAMYGGDCTGSGRKNLRELIEDVYGSEAGQSIPPSCSEKARARPCGGFGS